VTGEVLTFAALQVAAVLLDALVRPRVGGPVRSIAGTWLQVCMITALFGLFLALCGNFQLAAILALAGPALLVLASNAKHMMLGEPLLFSDLALVGAIFRHPKFYLSAVRLWQRGAVVLAAVALLIVLAWLFVPAPAQHMAGLTLLLASLTALALSLRAAPVANLAQMPDATADVRRHGLLSTLLLYWQRWRETRDPQPCVVVPRPAIDAPELVVIIQCESFADPVELFDDPALALPGLSAARAKAFQWGDLDVSGFGAYTMRTEYGVLFGRDEDALGFRRYDPFLTALGESSYALPKRLGKGWRSLFIHPHDMRFYGRDKIMPAGGFGELVGEDRFPSPGAGEGRYVTDAAMAEEIIAIARQADGPTLLYAVTIENHGPWAPDGATGEGDHDLVRCYLRLAGNSDAMLTTLLDRLAALGRPALLVFFGDHRPSIPGASMPGDARHTPYVMMRIDPAGHLVPGDNRRVDLAPSGLHHAVLDTVLEGASSSMRNKSV
jgi:hypothetical protein